MLVAASVVIGATLLAGADDTTSVWAVRADVGAGSTLTADDLEARDVRFAGEEQAAAYVSATDEIAAGTTVSRDLGAGELLPRAALGDASTEELVEVPLAVPADSVVTGLQAGETVDVWVTPSMAQATAQSTGQAPAGTAPVEAERVLAGVRIVAAPESRSALGPATTRQVVVGVPVADEASLGVALARLAAGTAVVVRRS